MLKLWSCFPWFFWNLCSLSQLLPTSYLSSCWSDAPFYGSEWSEESFGGIYETLVPYLKGASMNARLSVFMHVSTFFPQEKNRTFEVTLFLGHLWWKWLDELRFSTASGAPWQHLMPESPILSESDHRIKRSAKAWRGVLRDFCPLISHLKNCWTSWYPWMFSGILSPGGETLHKHFILLDHVVS